MVTVSNRIVDCFNFAFGEIMDLGRKLFVLVIQALSVLFGWICLGLFVGVAVLVHLMAMMI